METAEMRLFTAVVGYRMTLHKCYEGIRKEHGVTYTNQHNNKILSKEIYVILESRHIENLIQNRRYIVWNYGTVLITLIKTTEV
jgi:hypothetical protein